MANILIIDDEKASVKRLSEILSYEGYKVDEAADGAEGFKMFKDKEYDAILCDIKMPKMDGLEFLEKAKEINPDVPIIMVSGHGNIDTRRRCSEERGIRLYLQTAGSQPPAHHPA